MGRFSFLCADLHNRLYNSGGKPSASEYIFPYPDETFDFVSFVSAFTYLLPQFVGHFLSEISRVMKRNSGCLATFSLLNAKSRELIGAKSIAKRFSQKCGKHYAASKTMPEPRVAYDESYPLGLHANAGLTVTPPVHYGSWCGRERLLDYLDIILAAKTWT